MNVISASRRTDLPAFHTPWFLKRLEEGHCDVVPPFGGKPRRVSLTPEDVSAIVFWTRNPRPLVPHLDEIHRRGYRFYFLFTVLGSPRAIDPRVPPLDRAIDAFLEIASRFGPDAVHWRYDPIVVSSLTPPDWHLRQAAEIASRLEGATRRCYVSFVSLYRKTLRNLAAAARTHGFEFEDPPAESKRSLLDRLIPDVAARGIDVFACSQDELVGAASGAVKKASCVDAGALRAVAPDRVPGNLPLRPTREMCGCYASIDIGAYDTCLHGCTYCYAVSDPATAIARYRASSPEATTLGGVR